MYYSMDDPEDPRYQLPAYFDIQEGKRYAKYLASRSISVDIELKKDVTMDALWAAHAEGMKQFNTIDLSKVPLPVKDTSLLDLKLGIARKILESCILCERRCEVDRTSGQKGTCGVIGSRISSEFLHIGEEPELVPSHTWFFSGCTFKCVFCQNWDISQDASVGRSISPKKVAKTIDVKCGRNVNWVGGDPTSNLPFILEVLGHLDTNISQVWNSNMYLTEESMRLLDGIIDVYLTDFKYGNNKCGKRLSGVDRYFDIVTRNHLEANRQAEMIIRHLVLPNHFECCSKPLLDWIAGNLDNTRVRVNIMQQYRPEYKVAMAPDSWPEIGHRLQMGQWLKAYEHGRKIGLNLD
jgi:putative pyruvate formate lyase activating enzyme